jgi:hypothetical protein
MFAAVKDNTAFYDFYFYRSMIREKPTRYHLLFFKCREWIFKYKLINEIKVL